MIFPLDSNLESRRKSKSDNEAKKSCKVMTTDEKLKILCKVRGGACADEANLAFRCYYILKSNLPTILYYITQLVHK
jgi:hypothetical protein